MTLLTTTAIWAAVDDTFTANTVEGVEMTFKVTNEETKTCSVSSIPSDISGAVTIPATANGYTVTAIGYRAFNNCSGLTSISIPSSVTSIGNSAFWNCSGLTSISIPSSVTSIGEDVFNNCSGLTSISIPSSVTSIGNSAFWNCSGLTSISIPSSVTSIGEDVFNNCSGLTSISIPSSVTSIGNSAFWNCSGLTSISIPSSVTSIGEDAFGYCSRLSLVKVEWGNPISISSDVFSNNANMMLSVPVGTKEAYAAASYWKDFNIGEGDIYQGVTIDGICYDLMEDGLKATVVANTAAEYSGDITVPSSVSYEGKTYQVTAIGYRAFYYCSRLTSISIPSSVTSIGNGAFYYCWGLTSLSIPSSVTSIGDEAFYECWGLTSLSIPSSVTSIGDEAFNGCKSLTSISIPSSVTSIGNGAFSGCKSLTSISIPSSVTSIGSNAFNYCDDLSTVKVEWKVPVSISSNVFYKRESVMLNVPVGTKAAYVAASYWQDFNIVAGDIYQGVTIDGICYDLIEDGLKATVVANTAAEYSGDITVPSSVTYEGKTYQVSAIGNRAFSDCSGLTSIIIPNSVTSIGRYAFYWCDNLTSVSIPNSVTSISDWAFYSCDKLSSVKVEWDNPVGISSLVFSDRAVKMLNVPLGTKEAYAAASYWQDFNIGEGDIYQGVTIDGICYDLMEDGLKATVVVNTAAEYSGDITVPSSVSYEGKTYQVTAIGSSAFETCNSLNSVSIPSSVTSIGNDAFSRCESLTYVSIPSSVTSIGNFAFYDCSSLTSITIPGSVTNIGSYAFQYCDKLSTVKVEWVIPVSISSDVFSNREGKMLNVPLGTKEAYAAASYWQDFNIVEGDIYQGVTIDGICYDLMEDGLKATVVVNTAAKYSGEITIPSSVTYNEKIYQVTAIGSSAFSSCYSLSSVSIPSSVTMIGNSAFEGSSLTSVTIPNSVTSIGDDAFSRCSSLTSITIPGSVTNIGSYAFHNCSNLTSITIPGSVTSIGRYAFSGCNKLSSVKVEWDNPVNISSNVFSNRGGVMLNVPAGTKAAYEAADYWQDFDIVEGNIYQGVTIDGISYNLLEDGLQATVVANTTAVYSGDITIPSSVTYNEKFYQVTAIGSSAFSSCYSLSSVSIPSSVTMIGNSAFEFSNLTSVTIPNSVTSIGSEAFSNCSELTSITIPGSVTSIGSWAFFDCGKLSTVKVEWEIPVSISSDVFSNREGVILNVPVGKKEAYAAASYWQDFDIVEGNIYQGVTIDGISYNLIEDGLQATVVSNTTAEYSGEITIPSSVTYNEKIYQVTAIGSSAFKTCNSLNSVSIPSSVTMIGNSAFEYTNLTSITIPNSVTSIGERAFYFCENLTSVSIPNSVTNIGSYAFQYCDKLSTVKVEWEIPVSISSDVFSNREGVMLNVPAGTKAAYEAAEYWQDFDIAEGVSTTISSAGWATLYTDRALDFLGMEGLTAYTATLSGTTVTLTPVNDVPAGSGVVLKGAGGTYNIPAIASSATDGGDLKGSATEDLTYDASAANDYYMLALNDAGNAQFAKLTGGTITAGKAYLEVARSAARMLSIVVANGDATGIDAIEHTQPATSNEVYSLSGQRVSQPQKGLYIVGGKKVIIK